MSVATKRAPALLTPDGEVVELELAPVTADQAGVLLPRIRAGLAAIRRFEAYLADVIASEMKARGQRERRAGSVVYELSSEATWVVDDAGALFQLLNEAYVRDEITRDERDRACQQVVTHRFNHTALNVLAKRVPEIDRYRRRVEGEPRLRTK